MRNAILSTCLALPLLASGVPAFAASLTGNYTITLKAVRPSSLIGGTACLALTDNGGVDHWSHSGSWTFNGTAAGGFYVQGAVITLFTNALSGDNTYAVLVGKLFHGGVIGTAVTEIDSGVPSLTGNFTVTRGC